MRAKTRTTAREVGRLASRQHGVVTRGQLLAAGISPSGIERRAAIGLLLRVHRGVYRVGHRAPSTEARYMAAVLVCGEGAVLSGRSAAHLLGLIKELPARPEVTTTKERRPAGVRVRRSRGLSGRDRMRYRQIPITTVPRTLVDLAGELDAAELARAAHEAEVKHGTKPAQVEAALRRRPNSPGAKKLLRVLWGDVHVSLSALEARFLDLLRGAGLVLPRTNRPAGGRRVDCRWPELKLTVELDGYRYHHSRHSWEQDRRREREARARGDEFRRYTYGDVLEDPIHMLAELRGLLPGHDRDRASPRTTSRDR